MVEIFRRGLRLGLFFPFHPRPRRTPSFYLPLTFHSTIYEAQRRSLNVALCVVLSGTRHRKCATPRASRTSSAPLPFQHSASPQRAAFGLFAPSRPFRYRIGNSYPRDLQHHFRTTIKLIRDVGDANLNIHDHYTAASFKHNRFHTYRYPPQYFD